MNKYPLRCFDKHSRKTILIDLRYQKYRYKYANAGQNAMRLALVLFPLLFISSANALPPCSGQYNQETWHNCVGTFKYADGGQYVGEWKNDERNGQGTYTFANGNQYVGEFKDGKRNGQGANTWANGNQYIGEWKDDKEHGQGTYTFANGNRYVGGFKDNNFNGQGTYTYADGDSYVGEFKDNNFNGQGTYTHSSGNKYVGEFKEGKKHGQGTYTFGPDSKFEFHTAIGEFKDDEPVWPQTFIYPDGHQEIGRVENGVVVRDFAAEEERRKLERANALPDCPADLNVLWHNCVGTLTYDNSDKYVGEYKDDKKNGQGTYTYSTGDKYVGEYKDDKKNGQGTFTFANGDKYEGQWRDNKKHGQGTYTFGPDSKFEFHTAIGEFKDDEPVWPHTFIYPDGHQEIGRLENGVVVRDFAAEEQQQSERASALPDCPSDLNVPWHNCVGTYTADDGEKYVGEWKNDERNGQGTNIWADGDKYVGEWKNDKRNGQGNLTFANGDKYEGQWKDDKYNGLGTFTFANGNKYEGKFKDGTRNGHFTFTAGPNSEWEFHTALVEFKDDEAILPFTIIFPDGRRETGWFENDQIVLDSDRKEQRKSKVGDQLLQASSGSAFAVSHDGYLVTNNHVINGCEQVAIHSDGVKIPVSIVTFDLQNDLALLKGQFSPTHVFPIRRSNPALLEDIYVAGFPFGEGYSSSIKVTRGIISALNGIGNNFSNFQIDAALQPGNSGGPIVDDHGNVIGVAVAKLDLKYALENFGSVPENINFGIKSSVVTSVLDSQRIKVADENFTAVDKRKLGELISVGTYYVSCWMTTAQIEEMREKKVMFEDLK